jgi:LysM repeat protein
MKTRTPRPPAPRRAPRRILRPLHARATARAEEVEDYEGESEPNMKFSHALIVVLILHILAVGGVFAFNMLKTSHAVSGKSKAPVAEKQEARPQAAAPSATKAAVAQAIAKSEAKPASASACVPTHTVAAGDTLTKIASQHKTTVGAIEQANGLEDDATLHVGQVIKVKPVAKTDAPKESAPATKNAHAKADAAPVTIPKAAPAKSPASATTTSTTAKAAARPEPKPAASPAAPAKSPASGSTYTVAKGENPYSIAKKLKVSYSQLLKANKIEDPTKLQIGQKLIIP